MFKYVILIPNFNDWECLNILIPKISQALEKINEEPIPNIQKDNE